MNICEVIYHLLRSRSIMVDDVSYRAVVNSENITRSIYFSHGFPSILLAGFNSRNYPLYPRQAMKQDYRLFSSRLW